MLGSPQAASEFLARADIDGIKYPVDSYGSKGVKDGNKVGWNYVSFRDDNIRIDHKWVDGKPRFSVQRIAPIPELGTKRQDAIKTLASLKGNTFTNAETGITARLSSTGVGKLISNVAVAKTMANGFTADQHNAMAARIDELFVNATLTEDRPDRYGDANVKSIKRFVCPVRVGTTDAGAYITVKESVEHGNRIYSVEGIKIAALSPTVRRVIADHNSADNAASNARSIPYSAPESQAANDARFSV